MPRRASHLVALLVAFAFLRPAIAEDYSFPLPGLVGHYGMSDYGRELQLDLGMQFSQIDGISLRLAGNHQPGVLLPLGPGAGHPYPIEMTGTVDSSSSYLYDPYFDHVLPTSGGGFDLTLPFTSFRSPTDFSSLLDGEAEFTFTAAGGAFVAIYRVGVFPEAFVNSATLVVSGQQAPPIALPGDFNGNGTVDAADFLMWRKGLVVPDTQANYDLWRAHFGETLQGGAASSNSAAVPEPGSLASLLVGAAFFVLRKRGNKGGDELGTGNLSSWKIVFSQVADVQKAGN
jgi:hypothetical protein